MNPEPTKPFPWPDGPRVQHVRRFAVDQWSYRGWQIDYDLTPIPCRDFDWSATHPDFDGAKDGCTTTVYASTYEGLLDAIEDWIACEEIGE